MFKWQMYSAQDMRNRFNIMASLMAEENEHEDDDQDSIKEAFLETNIYLLVLTFVVSIIHSIFEFLAFKGGIAKVFTVRTKSGYWLKPGAMF